MKPPGVAETLDWARALHELGTTRLDLESSALTLGALVAFNGYLVYLSWPTIALGWILAVWQRGVAAWARVQDLLSTPPAIADAFDTGIGWHEARVPTVAYMVPRAAWIAARSPFGSQRRQARNPSASAAATDRTPERHRNTTGRSGPTPAAASQTSDQTAARRVSAFTGGARLGPASPAPTPCPP